MPFSRFSTSIATVVVLGGAAGLCWMGATAAAVHVERQALTEVRAALAADGYDWVSVQTDGLEVRLSGTAPNEVQRFRALAQAGSVIDRQRIVDRMHVAALSALTPPEFRIELLRNEAGTSLIGLVPAAMDRAALISDLRTGSAAGPVTDFLESADHPIPEGWSDALRVGLMAAQMSQRAKVSITAGRVEVIALADGTAEKARLETDLRRVAGGVDLVTDISAPRPVITPFTLRFLIDENGPRFDACASEDAEGQELILDAAREAGAEGQIGCTIGLGAPSPDWDRAAVAAIGAVARLGSGTVTISDADVALIAPAGTDPAAYDQVRLELAAALPPPFSLHAELQQPVEDGTQATEFLASRAADGQMTMRGPLPDQSMREAVDSLARSRFADTQSELFDASNLPSGWTVRVIAALEALSGLDMGEVTVTPATLRLTGVSGDPRALDNAAAILSQRLGAGSHYELQISYDRWLDTTLGLPSGDECVTQLNVVMSESEIGFEPSRSTIAGDPAQTLAEMAAIMVDCADYQIEVGGHTDSQGSVAFNDQLSQSRAATLLATMTEAGIPTTNMTAHGYGPSQPIADNSTEEGREANRRIEFRLLSPLPIRSAPLPPPVIREGVTTDAPDIAELLETGETATSDGPLPQPVVFGPVLPLPLIPSTDAPVIDIGPAAPDDWIGIAPAEPQISFGPVLPVSEATPDTASDQNSESQTP